MLGPDQELIRFTCPAAFSEAGWCYTGSENGEIQVWDDQSRVIKNIKAHAFPISCLVASEEKLISAGTDKRICIINSNSNFELEKYITMQ